MEPDTTSQSSYPVQFDVDYPDRELNRLEHGLPDLRGDSDPDPRRDDRRHHLRELGRTYDATPRSPPRGLLILPVVLMIVFRQKYPRWWFDWNLELMRFSEPRRRLPRADGRPLPVDGRAPERHARHALSGREERPEPLAAARQVDPRDPALRRAPVPRPRGLLRRRLRVVRDPLHRPLSARRFRLRGGRHPLVQPRPRLRVRRSSPTSTRRSASARSFRIPTARARNHRGELTAQPATARLDPRLSPEAGLATNSTPYDR